MLINLTNHPSAQWNTDQLHAARQYGEIIDLPFPTVAPSIDEAQLNSLAAAYEQQVLTSGAQYVLLQGEFVLCYRLISRLKRCGLHVLAAVSDRRAVDILGPDGRTVKFSTFRFYGFREY